MLIIVYFHNVTLPWWWYECHCDDYVSETNSGQPASAVHNEFPASGLVLVQEALLTPDADCLQVSVSGVNNPIYIPHRGGRRCYGAMRYPEGLTSLFRCGVCSGSEIIEEAQRGRGLCFQLDKGENSEILYFACRQTARSTRWLASKSSPICGTRWGHVSGIFSRTVLKSMHCG